MIPDASEYRRHRLNRIIKEFCFDIPVPTKVEDQLPLKYLEAAVQTELLACLIERNAT